MMKIVFYRHDRNTAGELVESILSSFTYEIGIEENDAIEHAIKSFEKEIEPKKWNQLAHGYHVW